MKGVIALSLFIFGLINGCVSRSGLDDKDSFHPMKNIVRNEFQFNRYTNYWHDIYREWIRYGNLFKIAIPNVEYTIAQSKIDIADDMKIPGLSLQKGFLNNLLNGQYVLLDQPAQPNKVTGKVKPFNGRPTIFINDKPEYPMIYSLTDVPGGRLTWEEMPQHNIKRMAEAGVKIFCFSIFFDQMWTAENKELDISIAQKMIKGVTDVRKDASIIIRLHVHPPQWWYKKYPDECVQYADAKAIAYDDSARFKPSQHNDPATVIRYSLASKKWKETMGKKVAEFCRKLSKTVEGNSVIGMQVAGGIYGEWHYWGFIQNYPDVSKPMNVYFREWLKNKYGNEEALKTAWNKRGVSFETAEVPDMQQRSDTHNGLFLDELTQRNLIDYNECQDELVANDIIYFAKTVKENWGRPIISGTFYGYFFPLYMRETVGGHLSVQKVLKSPYIDYLSGPQCYFPDAAKIGDPARSRGLVTSCFLNGKLWLDEYDTQPDLSGITHIGADKNTPKYDSIINSALAIVRRNMSVSAVRGQGFWFFDFGIAGGREYQETKVNGSNGWWDFPFILEDIGKAKKIFEKQMLNPYQSQSDVLMVYDTKIFYELTTDKNLLSPVYVTDYWISAAVWKAGVAADYIHIDDLDKVNIDQYKVVVFNNTFRITPQQRELITEILYGFMLRVIPMNKKNL